MPYLCRAKAMVRRRKQSAMKNREWTYSPKTGLHGDVLAEQWIATLQGREISIFFRDAHPARWIGQWRNQVIEMPTRLGLKNVNEAQAWAIEMFESLLILEENNKRRMGNIFS
jgi:hypothetical protein